jgi:hypothetical protein
MNGRDSLSHGHEYMPCFIALTSHIALLLLVVGAKRGLADRPVVTSKGRDVP